MRQPKDGQMPNTRDTLHTAHTAIQDGRTAAFRSDREARAALSAWLLDGAEIIRRCRVHGIDRYQSQERIADIAMIALRSFDSYRGERIDPLDYAALRKWVECELIGELEGQP